MEGVNGYGSIQSMLAAAFAARPTTVYNQPVELQLQPPLLMKHSEAF